MSTRPSPKDDRLSEVPAHATGVVTIDLARIAANWRALANLVRPAECAAVVKADAYGLGAARVIPVLAAAGCRTFFVATLDEAIIARGLAPSAHILVLDGVLPGAEGAVKAANVVPVLSSLAEAERWARLSTSRTDPLACALHVDTGLNRLGLPATEVRALAANSHLLDRLDVRLVMSHLACADDPQSPKNAQQRDVFEGLAPLLPSAARSLAASDGLMLDATYHYDLVRPGYALYGGQAFRGGAAPVAPAVTLHVKILQTRDIAPGHTVGYSATWTPAKASRIAVIAAGYADGLFRRLSRSSQPLASPLEKTAAAIGVTASVDNSTSARPLAWVGIQGQFAPIVGRVSMDLVTVDITDIDGPSPQPGDLVEVIGPSITIEELGAAGGTIGYEVLTSLGRRFHRRYLSEAV